MLNNRAFLKLHYMREHPVLNLGPLRYNLFGKIQDEGQSAGNFNISSSETTREAFTLKDDAFKLWFIGFVEGDGSFIINKDGYLEFRITQSSKDAQVLFMIKKMLGFGVVRVQDSNRNTHCYRVRDKKNLLKLISIFNGSIFLESRRKQFKLWLEAFNLKYKENVLYLDKELKPSLNDSWLSGFTDTEGCFTCSITENKTKTGNLIRLRYILSQKGNSENMDHLANILGGKKHFIKSYDGYNVVVNTTKLSPIVQYFSVFSLKTKKYLTYFNWTKIYKLITNKEHTSIEGFTLIKKYKNNMNRLSSKEQILESNMLKVIMNTTCFSVILFLLVLYVIYILIHDIVNEVFSPVWLMRI
uniref:LAGLIDADG endonuclease n=1 Tax=Metarhizium rileyi (strain RCEF 4871) TaxID=1649241 RepID=A0A6H0B7Y7_METRR|nr:LAGLIDADG endonuclease [Metarhizium rileyi]QIS49090.1 LAGLIDADG endonuclease [Metarhizium rileyi]